MIKKILATLMILMLCVSYASAVTYTDAKEYVGKTVVIYYYNGHLELSKVVEVYDITEHHLIVVDAEEQVYRLRFQYIEYIKEY